MAKIMLRRWLAIFLIVGMVFGWGAGSAQAAAAPEMTAASYVLMSADTGEVLNAANADVKRYPASTTKIMTMVLALEAVEEGRVRLDDMVNTSAYAASMGGSQVYLEAGEQRSLEEMLIGMIRKSRLRILPSRIRKRVWKI